MAELSAVAKLKDWVAENLQTLQAANVEAIVGQYSGSGDEGNSEGIYIEPAEAWAYLDEKLRAEVSELIDEACNEVATPDYETEDGGGGELKLIVGTGKLLHSEYNFEMTRSYTAEDREV